MKFNIWKRELEFNQETKIITYKDKVFKPSIRTFGDMKELYNKWTIKDDYGLYYMYRDIYFDDDNKQLLRKNNIRYDITIILPKIISGEYNKTYWHYHPLNKKLRNYQELYQVLSWKAIYLQQNKNKAFFIEANTWNSVNMEEWFWHITINPNKYDVLIMANLVDDSFSSNYNEYKKNKWWMYYLYTNWWETNEYYIEVPNLEEDNKLFPSDSGSIYDDFLKNPEKFNYLH